LPLNINFGNVVRRETKKFLDDIEKAVNLLENDKILKEFKRNDLAILKKAGLPFLSKNFQSYNHKKKIDSIILINIGYLSISKKSGIQIKDLDFLEVIINLLSSEDFFKYGLISFHLLLNRYVRYEKGIHGYNNFFFQELIKEIDETKRDFLYQMIIEGITNNKETEKNPNHFFEILDKHISTDYRNIGNLTYNLFFEKVFKINVDLLKKYKDPLFNLVESHISQIFQRDNVFTVFKHIYVNLYNEEIEIFQKMDNYLEKNIENIGFFSKLIDLINNFMPKNFSHSFYKKFYKNYFNLSYQLKEQRKFYELGLLWNGFNIYSLKDSENEELFDKEYFKKLIDDFKIIFHSGESTLFNAIYMELEELLNLRPMTKPTMLLENSKEPAIEVKKSPIEEQKNELTEDKLLQILINDMATLQQKNRAIKEEEDKYTVILSEILNRSLAPFNYFTDVQDLSGKTDKMANKKPELGGMGELDLRFLNGSRELCHIGEALILDSIRTDYTKAHLKKIFDYDANGLPINFMIIYSKVKNLYPLWQKYSKLVEEYEFEYPITNDGFLDLSEKLSKYAGIKVGLTNHLRAGRICKLYHFFLDFS
jgi:hypothetical protein